MSGYLTADDIRRTMDDPWHQSRPSGFTEAAPSADEAAERASDEVEARAAAHPRLCGAVLFPLEPSRDIVTLVVHEAWANGVPVHLMVPYGGPVQGPRPAARARDPHPDSLWHWDGRGTWWR